MARLSSSGGHRLVDVWLCLLRGPSQLVGQEVSHLARNRVGHGWPPSPSRDAGFGVEWPWFMVVLVPLEEKRGEKDPWRS